MRKFMNWLSVPKHNAPIFWTCIMICYTGIIALCILCMAVDRNEELFLSCLGNILFFLELLPMSVLYVIDLVHEPVKVVSADKTGNTNSKV